MKRLQWEHEGYVWRAQWRGLTWEIESFGECAMLCIKKHVDFVGRVTVYTCPGKVNELKRRAANIAAAMGDEE